MSTKKPQKITRLLAEHRPGTAFLSGWLERNGFSRDLQHRYLRSGWLEPLGPGAFRRTGDDVTWLGAVASLQQQSDTPLHPGALSALELHGLAHYARFDRPTVFLFSPPRKPLPAWFRRHDWGVRLSHHSTSLLPPGLGLQEHDAGPFLAHVSSPERAILECLHLAPDEVDLVEMRDVFPALAAMRPKLLQQLMEACSSIKAKRLLLYLADLSDSPWAARLDRSRLDLGRGHRRLVEGGRYVAEYQLTVPEGLFSP